MRLQLLAPLFRYLIQTGVNPFQTLKIGQQLRGALRPNTGDTRNLRAADACQPPVIRQLLRRDAELAGNKRRVQPAFLKIVANADSRGEQLAVAFVS